MSMNAAFVYGSLLADEVVVKLLGRVPNGTKAYVND